MCMCPEKGLARLVKLFGLGFRRFLDLTVDLALDVGQVEDARGIGDQSGDDQADDDRRERNQASG